MTSTDARGKIIADRYQIITLLGRGGMGTTYAAIDLQEQQKVAVKVVSLREAKDWKVLELFEREAQTLANLDHPFIPNYINYFQIEDEDDRNFYLVQELVEGRSLSESIESGWRPDEKNVRAIAIELLKILTYLHQLHPPVIHRDIKPQNIILREADRAVYLVDFGTVQTAFRNTQSFASTFVGTVGYIPIEQLRGQTQPASDLYSLGMTLIYLLTGEDPGNFPRRDFKVDFGDSVRLSPHFSDWLNRAIEPFYEDRFKSAQEALDALQHENNLKQLKTAGWEKITYRPNKRDNIRATLLVSERTLIFDAEYQTITWQRLAFSLLFIWFPPIMFLIIFLSFIPMRKCHLEINRDRCIIKYMIKSKNHKTIQFKTRDISGVTRYSGTIWLWQGTKPYRLTQCETSDDSDNLKRRQIEDIEKIAQKIDEFIKKIKA